MGKEFRDYVYVRKVYMGGRYKFQYGRMLTKNLPEAFAAVLRDVTVFSSVEEAKNAKVDLIAKPSIPKAYTKISGTGMPMPTKIEIEIQLLDHQGMPFQELQAKGESSGKMAAGKIAASYLFPIATMSLLFGQLEKSQNDALSDMLANLSQKLLSARGSILSHCPK